MLVRCCAAVVTQSMCLLVRLRRAVQYGCAADVIQSLLVGYTTCCAAVTTQSLCWLVILHAVLLSRLSHCVGWLYYMLCCCHDSVTVLVGYATCCAAVMTQSLCLLVILHAVLLS